MHSSTENINRDRVYPNLCGSEQPSELLDLARLLTVLISLSRVIFLGLVMAKIYVNFTVR